MSPVLTEAGLIGKTFGMDPLLVLAADPVDYALRRAALQVTLRAEYEAEQRARSRAKGGG